MYVCMFFLLLLSNTKGTVSLVIPFLSASSLFVSPSSIFASLRALQSGPFIDENHPCMKSGEIIVSGEGKEVYALTPRELWESKG